MNKQIIYVVTNPELGWDCVVGCFSDSDSIAEYLEDHYQEFLEETQSTYTFNEFLELNHYIIHEKILI